MDISSLFKRLSEWRRERAITALFILDNTVVVLHLVVTVLQFANVFSQKATLYLVEKVVGMEEGESDYGVVHF